MSHVRNPYDTTPPCNPFDVPLADSVEDGLDADQIAKITQIRLQHARIVSNALSEAYSQILAVVAKAR